jgi:hypothetical protein
MITAQVKVDPHLPEMDNIRMDLLSNFIRNMIAENLNLPTGKVDVIWQPVTYWANPVSIEVSLSLRQQPQVTLKMMEKMADKLALWMGNSVQLPDEFETIRVLVIQEQPAYTSLIVRRE